MAGSIKIPFNKPYLTGKETEYIQNAVKSGKISGDGHYTKLCQKFFQDHYNFKKCLLTTSCTDALEMAAILINAQPGDEIIIPSYTFVSTANAFVLRGANIVFADSSSQSPHLDVDKVEALISPKTKAIVVVHYAGTACDMDKVMEISSKHNLFVIEDAAQAIDSYYKGKPLGSIGHLGTFSFHESKNIIAGEGGLLSINDTTLFERAEIIWEKGTNRAALFRGETDKYTWKDIGSSFLPSDITAAFLYAQLENIDKIQERRKAIWNRYYKGLQKLEDFGFISRPKVPDYASNNAHMFYLLCRTHDERNSIIQHFKSHYIKIVFHYLPLHESEYYLQNNDLQSLKMASYYGGHLLRLPMYFELKDEEIDQIIQLLYEYFEIED